MPPLMAIALLVVGATYRLTRLLVRDQFPPIAWPRETLVGYCYPDFSDKDWQQRYVQRHGTAPKPHLGSFGHAVAYLATCDWCASMYVGTAVTLAFWHWSPWLRPYGWVVSAALALIASAVTGLIAQQEPE